MAKTETPGSAEHLELLDFGIDFSADVDTPNALAYAWRGLTGAFRGTFKRIPFYYKVREYNDYESRDLWEYDLSLSPEERLRLATHLWELGDTWFDYWYLTENCSYHVLGALEAARPDLELLAHVRSPVVPADTVRALLENEGLVRAIRFRPSLRRTFRARLAGLDSAGRDAVAELARDPAAAFPDGLSDEDRIRALDAAADLVDLRHAKELVFEKGGEGHDLKQALLTRRAAIGKPSPALEVVRPEDEGVHLGHAPRRFGAGAAIRDGGARVWDLRWRLTLHDLADPSAGHPDLASLEILPIRLRWRESDRFDLRDLEVEADLARIVSLTPLDAFDLQPSWSLRGGVTTVRDGGCPGCLAGLAAFGGGGAIATPGRAATLFALAEARAFWGPDLAGIEGTGIRAGLGPSGGVRLRFHPRLLALAGGAWLWLPGQEIASTWEASAVLRWQVAEPLAIDLEGRAGPLGAEGGISLLVYH